MRDILTIVMELWDLLYAALATPEGEALLHEIVNIIDGQAMQPPAGQPAPTPGQPASVASVANPFANPR